MCFLRKGPVELGELYRKLLPYTNKIPGCSLPPLLGIDFVGTRMEFRERSHRAPLARDLGCYAENYLYVALVRASMSRCSVKSTIEPKAGPPKGFAFRASRTAALTLSMASAFAAR